MIELPRIRRSVYSNARRITSITAGLALAVSVSSCDKSTTSPGASQEIVLGGLFSLTGNWATLGVTSKAAMEIGIDDVNQYVAGGNSGLHFTASIQDTKLDPATSLTQATAMKASGVEVIIGPQSSAEVAALKPFVDANTMLLISQSSTAGTLAIANDNIFRLTPSDTLEAVALAGVMKADGMKTIIPLWRNDAGNIGLQVATRALFASTGTVKAGVQYDAATTDFAPAIAALKTQVQAAITERGGTAGVAVADASFDEIVDIMKLAAADPVLSSVRWYGTDGTALNEPLRTNAVAAAFAKNVGFWTPTPGVDDAASARWQPVATRIAARAGMQPDAFALAVYDAVWLAAQSYLAVGGLGHQAALKAALVTSANGYYGASGWTKLNPAGDRQFGDFDFFSLSQSGTTFSWGLAAQFNTQTGILTRK
jgi:branched-chain amino acid transport system substrate-binding protein